MDDSVEIIRNGSSETIVYIDVLANDSFGSDGPMTRHSALSLINGKLDEVSANNRRVRVFDNGTPSDYSDDIIGYYMSNNPSLTSDSFTYYITDNSGDATSATVTITYTDGTAPKTLSTNNYNGIFIKDNSFITYPNPSKGYFKTALFSSIDTDATISIFDASGREVYSKKQLLSSGKNELEFNFNKKGFFFLKIVSKEIDFGTSKIILE